MRILLVEDDETIAAIVSDFLQKQHYVLDVAIDGELGWNFVDTYTYDLILLDVMLPKLDGMSLCRKIRNAGLQMPILLLTAKQTSDDKVMGLDVGADDYLVKPFDLKELAARIRALLRRGGSILAPLLEWGDLYLDPSSCLVTYKGRDINLSNKEYSLLELFLRNSRRILNRSMILDHLWAGEDVPTEDTVKAHIKGLRRKFRAIGAPEDLIENIYGIGYRLKALNSSVDRITPQIILAGLTNDLEHYLENRLASCLLTFSNTSSATLASLEEGNWQLLVLDQMLLTPQIVKVLNNAYSRLKQGNQLIIYCLERDGVEYLPQKILGQLLFYPFEAQELVHIIAENLSLSLPPETLEEIPKQNSAQNLTQLPSISLPEPSPLPDRPPTSELESNIATLWDKFKDKIHQRLVVLETAKTAYLEGEITPELQQQVISEAHKLAGSLGTFGFPLGTQLARKIEDLFLENLSLSDLHQQEFMKLLEHLQELLQSPPPSASEIRETKIPEIALNNFSFYGSNPQLLIVEDDQELAQGLALEASSWGMQVEVIHCISQARLAIAAHPPDLVLLDIVFPEAEETGLQLLQELSNAIPPIPAIILTLRDSFPSRLEVARLGGCGFLAKPVTPNQVMQSVVQVVQQNYLGHFKVMIVDDDPTIFETLVMYLKSSELQLVYLEDPRNFWETLESSAPDLLILDIKMPYINGIELCRVIRNDPHWSSLPVLFISNQADRATVQQVFGVGADDFISKPLSEDTVVTRVLNRLQRLNMMRSLSEVDLLTGMANRRKFTGDWERSLRLVMRNAESLCLAILDLDNFKVVNDRYGHEMGDRVLQEVGRLLLRSFRQEDLVARWGGEEFIVSWYGITKEEASQRLEKVLADIRALEFTAKNGQTFGITFSAGIVQYPEDGDKFPPLYHRADHLLYQAKQMGRDRILYA